MERRPDVVILEDPTAGIDIGSKVDLYEAIFALAREGTSVLLLSSDLGESIQLCHRLYVMYAGTLVDEIEDPGEDNEARILAGVLGSHGSQATEQTRGQPTHSGE